MATTTITITAFADDGVEDVGASSWGNVYTPVGRVGQRPSYTKNIGLRFPSVGVPQGASVTSAFITVDVNSINGSGGGNVVYGDDVDDAAAWGASSRPSQITQTSASAAFSPGGTGSYAVGITSVVQEIVDRTGWSSNNDMRFGLINTGDGGGTGSYNSLEIDLVGTYGSPVAPKLKIVYSAGGTAYDITAESGTYTVTGADANLEYGYALDAEAGAYTVTGADAGLQYSSNAEITAEAGSYAITGADAELTASDAVDAEGGTYSVTGADVDWQLVRYGDPGSYAITGADATLSVTTAVVAESTSYTITGADVTLTPASRVDAEGATYAITGADAAVLFGRAVDANSGSYAVTGADATLTRFTPTGFVVDAESDIYTWTGTAAELQYGHVLEAEGTTYAITGADATLTPNLGNIAAEAGAYALTGADVNLSFGGPDGWTRQTTGEEVWTVQ